MPAPDGTPLLGRDDVLDQLLQVLDGVGAEGVAVVLTGEPGIGKSTVLAHATEHARAHGFTVLGARGSQSEAQLPYANLDQLLRPVLGHVDELPARQRQSLLACFGRAEATDVNPFFTSLATLELLVRSTGEAPLLVSLDDLHLMDRPTLDTLAFVARRIGLERVVMLGTSLPGGPVLGDEATVRWIRLDGLPEAAAHRVLEVAAPELGTRLRDRVVEEAGGNPLALVELAKAVQQGNQTWTELDRSLPMTTRLERAFVARADGLDPASRAVLDVAVLDDGDDLGQVLAAAAVVSGSGVDPAAAQPAVELGLLALEGSTYSVTHPLMGSALRRAMSRERQRRVHAALADVLRDEPQRAVWHRAGAALGRDETIAAELEQAAADARRRGAFATAQARLERAAALSPDPQDQAARLLGAAELGYELGRFAQVEAIRAQVGHLTLRPRDRSRLTRLEGVFHDGVTSEPAEILHLVDLARTAIGADDTDLAMQLLFGAARRVWWRDPGAAVRREIVVAADEASLPAQDPRVLVVRGLTDSLELGAEVMEQLDRWPVDAVTGADLAAPLGIAAFCVGDFLRADAFLSVAVHELRTEGRLSLLAEALAIRAWGEINLGIFDAGRSADEGMRLAEETGQRVWAGTAGLAVAAVDAISGRWQEHHPLLAKAEHIALQLPNASSSLLAGAQQVRGLRELGADRPEQAFGEMARVFVPTDGAYQRVQQLWTLGFVAEAAVRGGRREDASALVTVVEEMLQRSPAVGAELAREYCRAVLADDGTAEGLFRDALSGAARPFPWHQARLQLAFGSWLRRQRRVTESRDPLRAARTAFEALGARPWATRADQELRATGERSWQPAASGREQLSPQEAQIAELAARGLSNREIGQRLFLSHRTVGSHLYHVFPKLGITSRQQLADVLGSATGAHGGHDVQSSD